MKPVIALVGRPNVGKSTLFNRLTKSRDALVADFPGLTRDRHYGLGKMGDKPYIVVDTGGLGGDKGTISGLMESIALQAVDEADVVVFLVDGRAGLIPADEEIIRHLRTTGKTIVLGVNKAEGLANDVVIAEFRSLGLEHCFAISASHGDGVRDFIDAVLELLPGIAEPSTDEIDQSIKVAIAGRPNVGKSTLVNKLLGEKRVLAFDQPGTTRDSIYIPFERGEKDYTLIDTAGVRRRGKVTEMVEKFSVIKALQAVSEAHVVILVLDAQEGITEQDTKVLGYVLDSGKALVVAVNKWDGLDNDHRKRIKQELSRKLSFIDFAEIHFISALHGTGVDALFEAVDRAYQSATTRFPTPRLSRILEGAVEQHAPPLVKGRRIKLRYAHQGGHAPPLIVIHGNQTKAVPESYRRYLSNVFRRELGLEGTPVRIEFKSGANPFKGKKNVLTERQQNKRRRNRRFLRRRAK